ncbi:GATA zinc finger domain-containing protein 14-like [Acyrthosiphon pisum]|uniref:Retrotransposon gag domain-containing protein n=1 Tax=Acyrthosiphon pisum TaxID=7029 RepID=A0A8R2NX35_ACYPI|nr:GATA zinc finger domain-containing protein 14-like [Acyrthosiphon pisum]
MVPVIVALRKMVTRTREKEEGIFDSSDSIPDTNKINKLTPDSFSEISKYNLRLYDNFNASTSSFVNNTENILENSDITYQNCQKESSETYENILKNLNNSTTIDSNNTIEKPKFENENTAIIINNQKGDNLNSEIHSTPLNKQTLIMTEKMLMIRPAQFSAFVKGTSNTFLENFEDKNNNWTWNNLKQEFLEEFQPIGYNTILKTKLENRQQGDTESIMSFVTEIENIYRSRSYNRETNYRGRQREYRDKSPYPGRYNDRSRESSRNRQYGRDRSQSRKREYYNKIQNKTNTNQDYDRNPSHRYDSNNYEYRDDSRNRETNLNIVNGRSYRNRSHSRDRDNNGYYNYSYRHQYSREHSQEKTPERYRGDRYIKESEIVTCYRCNEKGRSRPTKTFDESSARSKRRKCQLLYKSSSLSELSETTSYAFRKIGNEDTAKLVKEAANSTPTRGKKIRDVWKENKNTLKSSMMSPEVALSLIIACSLPKFQYNMLRKNAKEHNRDLYPSYDQLLVEKVNAYPKQITIEE